MPSERLTREVALPVPTSAVAAPSAERLTRRSSGEVYTLSARTLIPIAFDQQPDIKSSFQRFKSEEARYDFFYTSRDSLTPRLRTTNDFGETRTLGTQTRTAGAGDGTLAFTHRVQGVTRTRDHAVELAVEKRFFDTTQLDVAVGYDTSAVDEAIGNHPFVSATLRYPLWASREKLERTSEDIFRRNELDDAQLAYIQEVRRRLSNALFQFYMVRNARRRLEYRRRWHADLEALRRRVDAVTTRDVATDRSRISAEVARVGADVRTQAGRYEIDLERFKAACGLAFHVTATLVDEPFNPFENASHEELLRLSIETDPEIATLRNAVRNSEVQLDLARRGRWDISLLLSADANLEGRGEDEGASDWSASVGFDVSAVDRRVTDSLMRQAQANIARFKQAIAARENAIFVDTLEPLIRIETVGASRADLIANLPRFVEDYETGLRDYDAGHLNIDDLLKRRETLFDQEQEISSLTFLIGANVAELCAATGKFFELLDGDEVDTSPDAEPTP